MKTKKNFIIYSDFDDTMSYDDKCDQINIIHHDLHINVGNTIIAIADLGLWNGNVVGYKEIYSGYISDCFYSSCDYNKWYCDAYNLRATMSHHDGTNHILYRKRKDNISDKQWDNFINIVYNGEVTPQLISRYTISLLPYIKTIYDV